MGKPTGFLEYNRIATPTLAPLERIKNFLEFHPSLELAKRREQAARCMNCGVPFCQSGTVFGGMVSGCPLHNLIPEWNDAVSSAIFAKICEDANVPVQRFANRSDMGGGSTLGSISNTNAAMITVDIGLAQLAMHSSYETAGTKDTGYMIDAITQFYKSKLTTDGDGSYTIE